MCMLIRSGTGVIMGCSRHTELATAMTEDLAMKTLIDSSQATVAQIKAIITAERCRVKPRQVELK